MLVKSITALIFKGIRFQSFWWHFKHNSNLMQRKINLRMFKQNHWILHWKFWNFVSGPLCLFDRLAMLLLWIDFCHKFLCRRTQKKSTSSYSFANCQHWEFWKINLILWIWQIENCTQVIGCAIVNSILPRMH